MEGHEVVGRKVSCNCGWDLIVANELENLAEGFQVGVVGGVRVSMGSICLEGVCEILKRAGSSAWFETFKSLEHDVRVNFKCGGILAVTWGFAFGEVVGGFWIKVHDKGFDFRSNGGNRHGFSESREGSMIVIIVSCYLSCFSFRVFGSIRGVGDSGVSLVVEGFEVTKAELAETLLNYIIDISFGVWSFGVEDDCVKDELKVPKRKAGGLVGGRGSDKFGGRLQNKSLDVM